MSSGRAELKKSLVACGGFATAEIWKAKFKQLFGVEPRQQWVDDHFGVDRSEQSVFLLPVFMKKVRMVFHLIVVISIIQFFGTKIKSGGKLVYQERSPGGDTK